VSDTTFCCEAARDEGAPLGGTASRALAWLLVEHRGAWGADAVAHNDLPDAVRAWMTAQVAALGKARPLLIRQETASRQGVTCFLAVAGEDRRELYRFAVDSAEQLAGLDLAADLAAGKLRASLSDELLTLVCTNGKRDRCCARHGVPTSRALAALEGTSVWQSSHQGGHRYAASALWLPEGVCYGYLRPEDAPALVAARRAGTLVRERFRGRTFHAAPVQAADVLLREALCVDALEPWRLVESTPAADDSWRVRFASADRAWLATVRSRRPEVLVSCSPPKVKAIEELELVDWREEVVS
jgi:hypothetical protein